MAFRPFAGVLAAALLPLASSISRQATAPLVASELSRFRAEVKSPTTGWGGRSGRSRAVNDDVSAEVGMEGAYKQILRNDGDVQYTGEILVGGQPLQVVLDTGSFELLVFDRKCTVCGEEKFLYDGRKSPDYEMAEMERTHNFGSGSTSSREAFDRIDIGPFSVQRQSIWDVYDANMPILRRSGFQAILGVGPPSGAMSFAHEDVLDVHRELDAFVKSGGHPSEEIMNTVRHYDEIAEHSLQTVSLSEHLSLMNMSICLGKESGSDGYFLWNDTATLQAPERFVEVQVVGDIYWSANLTDVNVGPRADLSREGPHDSTILGCNADEGPCSVIIDSGTSLIAAPSREAVRIQRLVEEWAAAGGTCEDVSKLPDLEFKLNGQHFSLPPQAYVGRIDSSFVDENLERFMPHLFDRRLLKFGRLPKMPWQQDSFECESLVMTIDISSQFGPMWIFGMPFFRKYFTTFGFAAGSQDSTPPTATKAATMAFSVADPGCRPHTAPAQVAPGVANELFATAPAKELFGKGSGLRVETGKILHPFHGRSGRNMHI